MKKYDIESIQLLMSNLQDDPELFAISYGGFPLWSIVKNRLFNALLDFFIKKREATIIKKIFPSYKAVIQQFFRLPVAYFEWFKIKHSLNNRKKSIAVLLIDGFFRNKNIDGVYVYPFGEEIQQSINCDFEIISIERNHRLPKRGKPFIRPSLSEDIVSLIIPLQHYFLKNKELEKKKEELLSFLNKKLVGQPSVFNVLEKELYSPMTDHLLYGFVIKKEKAKKILLRLNPFSLLLTAPVGLLWWVAAAKELNIRVIEYQHGVIHKFQPQYNWPTFLKTKKSNLLTPDTIFMWGNYWVEENLMLGFWNKEELISCGLTKIDLDREKYSELIQSSFTNSQKGLITYVYTSDEPIRTEAIKFLERFLSIVKNNNMLVKIVIKLHPYEDSEYKYYDNLKKMYPSFCEVYYHSEKKIYDLFVEASVHLSVYSASILESIALGRPTLILNLPGKEYSNNLIEKRVVRYAESPADLVNITELIKNNPMFWKEWIDDTTAYKDYFFSKNSAETSINYLNRVMSSKKVKSNY